LQSAFPKPCLRLLRPRCDRFVVRTMVVCFLGRTTTWYEKPVAVCSLQFGGRRVVGPAVVPLLPGARPEYEGADLILLYGCAGRIERSACGKPHRPFGRRRHLLCAS